MRFSNIKDSNRKLIISIWSISIIIILIISIGFLALYAKRNSVYYVHYDEKSDLDYEVVLKENEYFEEDHLNEDNQYIAKLIDSINTNFKYDLAVKEDLTYNYRYKITADVNVKDNTTNKPIYTYSEDLLNEVTGKSDGALNIDENIKVDYQKYNEKISEFVNVYKLSDVTSMLTLKMYVGIDGDLEQLNKADESVISLDIPLTTNTVAIDMKYDLSDNVDNLIALKSDYQNSIMWVYVAGGLFLLDLALLRRFYWLCDNFTNRRR